MADDVGGAWAPGQIISLLEQMDGPIPQLNSNESSRALCMKPAPFDSPTLPLKPVPVYFDNRGKVLHVHLVVTPYFIPQGHGFQKPLFVWSAPNSE